MSGGWVMVSAGQNGNGATWHHEPTGCTIQHCGHPTANFPYALFTPTPDDAGSQDLTIAENGRAFRSVAAAKRAVELLHAGEARLGFDERRGLRVLLGVDSNGERFHALPEPRA